MYSQDQIHECKNCERGRAVSFLEIHKSDFRYSALLFMLAMLQLVEINCFLFSEMYDLPFSRFQCGANVDQYEPAMFHGMSCPCFPRILDKCNKLGHLSAVCECLSGPSSAFLSGRCGQRTLCLSFPVLAPSIFVSQYLSGFMNIKCF
jgi:hypothetical protein